MATESLPSDGGPPRNPHHVAPPTGLPYAKLGLDGNSPRARPATKEQAAHRALLGQRRCFPGLAAVERGRPRLTGTREALSIDPRLVVLRGENGPC